MRRENLGRTMLLRTVCFTWIPLAHRCHFVSLFVCKKKDCGAVLWRCWVSKSNLWMTFISFLIRKLLKVGHMNFVREKFSPTHWFFIDFGSQLWADYFHPISVISLKLLFDPSTLQSDKHPISPKTTTPKSNIEVMGIVNWCYGVKVNLKSVSRTFYLHRQGNL